MRNGAHSKREYKWIMDSEAPKHMTLHRIAFHTYEVITLHYVDLGDNNVLQANFLAPYLRCCVKCASNVNNMKLHFLNEREK